MNRVAGLLLATLLFAIPLTTSAAFPLLDPDFAIVPEACRECPCGLAGVLQLAQNLMNAAISFGIIVMTLVIAYAGALFLFSPTNPELRGQGKKLMTNAVIGFVIVLAAWLIVDFVMKSLYNGETEFGPWNEILNFAGGDMCIQQIELGALYGIPDQTVAVVNRESGTGTVQRPAGAGSCRIPGSGPCSPSALPEFGAAASQAAQICDRESRGVIGAISGSDRMRNDPNRRAFSFGLFQINITQHRVGGHNCPAAFRGKNYDAVVINEDLYKKCAAAAVSRSGNIAEAVATYNRTRWREWSTARGCGLALADATSIAYRDRAESCDSRTI